ncbi:MAG: MFS transporter [Lachnospiraceae bacterium]|nr:MFS transporter [Lachnospiraceae bacterium]
MEHLKITKQERCWILYDVGNSAFILLVSTIIPIYFNHLAASAGMSEVDYLAYWGYAASISTVIVALIGPVLGAIADTKSFKKPLFTACMLIGVIGCGALAVPLSWMAFLAVFILAKVGYNASLIFYDSMLVDVTTVQRLDQVSSHGYAWGYIGSCIPFVVSLGFVLLYRQIGISMRTAVAIAFFLNAAWWLLFSIPLLKTYEQKYYVQLPKRPARDSFQRLFQTLCDIKNQKHIFWYLLSFFFFIDGVYTIIEMATAYGSALGLASSQLLLALLATQLVAFPCALVFSRLSKTCETSRLLKICILAYTGISLFAVQLDKQWEFWVLAVLVGMFQGAIQALSRSYFAKIIPTDKSGEYFGIYDICGKGASFLGTTLVGAVTQITGAANAGVPMLTVLFLIGFVLFSKAAKLGNAA